MSMTDTDVICREAAEAALRRYGGQFRREVGETLHIGSCGDAFFSVDHTGPCEPYLFIPDAPLLFQSLADGP